MSVFVDNLKGVHLFLVVLLNNVLELVNLFDCVLDCRLFFFSAVEHPFEQVACAHLKE